MISTIRISDPTKTPINWLPKVKFLSEPKDYEFTPGLNILWGKNGSGKSTLLRLIARLFHAEQGRVSTITQHSLEELFGHFSDKQDRLAGVAVSHDGQGIVFYDPSDKVGLIGGGAAFDDDFFTAGISSMMMKGSSGELTLNNLGSAMASIKDVKYVKPNYKIKKTQYSSDTRNKQIEDTERFFEKDIEPGKTTIIFDEPDRSIDIPSQQQMWNAFARFDKVQLIVATHSTFAANIPTANYIESSPGYLEQCRKAIKTLT
jgi:energy-coupling factor transporter ATP-binding protein EcfA2